MPHVPDDLIPLADAMAAYPDIKQQWWYSQTSRGKLVTYRKPGYKGVFVSKAAVDDVTTIRPNVEIDDSDSGQAM